MAITTTKVDLIFLGDTAAEDETLSLSDANEIRDVTYPGSFFSAENPKPRITYRDYGNDTPGVVYDAIKNNTLSQGMAVSYLIWYFTEKKVSETISLDWTTYGVNLGKKIHPFIFVKLVVDSKDKEDYIVTPSPDEIHYDWMALYIVCIYRICRSPIESHRERIMDSIRAVANSLAFRDNDPLETTLPAYQGWENGANYMKAIACIDMFFARFKNHQLSYLRVGTIQSKYRDCSGLICVKRVSDGLNYPHMASLLEWIWSDRAINDTKVMVKNNQEIGYVHSYFPYQTDFGLITTSAYSTNTLAGLYFTVAAAGILMHNQTLLNAKCTAQFDRKNAFDNAVLIALAHSETSNIHMCIKPSTVSIDTFREYVTQVKNKFNKVDKLTKGPTYEELEGQNLPGTSKQMRQQDDEEKEKPSLRRVPITDIDQDDEDDSETASVFDGGNPMPKTRDPFAWYQWHERQTR